MYKPKKQAFTLVELIVVITILAILGTIAFISLQGYSSQARDSKRLSDIQNIKKSLELFSLNTGKYPLPDNQNEAIFSGSIIWTQGVVGDTMTTNLSRNLNEKPLDPLTETEYTYSSTFSQMEYELLAIYESDLVGYNNISNQINAATQNYPKIDGNYNGIAVKTPKFIIPTPSIINASLPISNEIDLETTIDSQIITGGDNNISNGTEEAKIGNLNIIFKSYEIPTNGVIDKAGLGIVIQETYTGSSLSSEGIYESILSTTTTNELITLVEQIVLNTTIVSSTQINNNTITYSDCDFIGNSVLHNISVTAYETETVTYGNTCNSEQRTCNDGILDGTFTFTGCLVDGATGTFNLSQTTVDQGTNVTITNNCSEAPTSYTSSNTGVATISGNTISTIGVGTTNITPVGGACADNNSKSLVVTAPDPYASCTNTTGQKFSTTTKYGSCNTNDIILCTGIGTGYTLAACNVGTNIAGTGSSSFGNFFQWGNNYGSIGGGSTTSTKPNVSSYNPPSYYSSTSFILGTGDWAISQNDNLWGDITNTPTARKGPCNTGYHVPSYDEMLGIKNSSVGLSLTNDLLLAGPGYRNGSTGNVSGSFSYYWTSSANTSAGTAYDLSFAGATINIWDSGIRGHGMFVRCIKN